MDAEKMTDMGPSCDCGNDGLWGYVDVGEHLGFPDAELFDGWATATCGTCGRTETFPLTFMLDGHRVRTKRRGHPVSVYRESHHANRVDD